MEITTTTIFINNEWHCRIISNGVVIDEMACKLKSDIGYCFSEMLSWFDKLGGESKMASASRSRRVKIEPEGKVRKIERYQR